MTATRIAIAFNDNDHRFTMRDVTNPSASVCSHEWEAEIQQDCSVVFTHLPNPTADGTTATIAEVEKITRLSASVMDAARAWAGAHQEMYANPSGQGLVQREIADPMRQRVMCSAPTAEEWVICALRDLLGELCFTSPIVWASPDADLDRFGTPYLTATNFLNRNETEWRLRHVGMEDNYQRDTQSAAWDDVEAFSALVTQCLDDPDSQVIQAALLDSERVGRMTSAFNEQVTLRQAREVFAPKKRQIRPLLVRRILEDALRRVARDTDVPIRGHVYPQDLRHWRVVSQDAPRIHMAARANLYRAYVPNSQRQVTSEEFRLAAYQVAEKAQSKLDERSLGVAVVAVDQNDEASVLVTKDVDLMVEYAAALGLTDTKFLVRGEDGQWAEYVRPTDLPETA